MTLTRRSPIAYRPARVIFDEMNRMLNLKSDYEENLSEDRSDWQPLFEINESKTEYLFSVDLPGMKREDIDVSVLEDTLTVSGERKTEAEAKDSKYIRNEISYGKFSRSFTISDTVNVDKITAEFKNGVLKLSIPKVKPVEPEVKKLKIK